MTSPNGGSWWDSFLDEMNPGAAPGGANPAPSGAPQIPGLPPVPGYTPPKPPIEGPSAPWAADTQPTMPTTEYGQMLFDILDLPEQYTADQQFWLDNFMGYRDHPEGIQMTVAAGLEWLRDLATTDKETYNALVTMLWQAGYITDADVRYGVYTNGVAQGFVHAAFDVAAVNAKADGGAVTSLFDNLDQIVKYNEEAGIGPGGAGSGAAPLTRQDTFTDEKTVRAQFRDVSRNVLGRKLTPEEEDELYGQFHSLEKQWNDKAWNAEQQAAAGQAVTTESRPSLGEIGDDLLREELPDEYRREQMGSYVGVMARMFGLDDGGMIGGAIT